ncbi:MAG: TIGR04076 family protein [Clostridia bacterium]|nr:TIGR04076 family protein [Clostridia bacterium]
MKRWVVEDWEFELTAIEGKAAHCRLGIEKGDRFVFSYECPAGMCPRVMMEVFTWCEVIRCGGDFTYRGMKEKYEMEISCPCGSIMFRLKAAPINRDDSGNPLPNNPMPE